MGPEMPRTDELEFGNSQPVGAWTGTRFWRQRMIVNIIYGRSWKDIDIDLAVNLLI